MAFITDAPWTQLTYKIIGLAMEVHNELGPGHREYVYHNAMVAKLKQIDLALKMSLIARLCWTTRLLSAAIGLTW